MIYLRAPSAPSEAASDETIALPRNPRSISLSAFLEHLKLNHSMIIKVPITSIPPSGEIQPKLVIPNESIASLGAPSKSMHPSLVQDDLRQKDQPGSAYPGGPSSGPVPVFILPICHAEKIQDEGSPAHSALSVKRR
jgi:hypothetical protein